MDTFLKGYPHDRLYQIKLMATHKPIGGPIDFFRLAARFKSVSDPTRIRLLFLRRPRGVWPGH